jgi:hypothetical protein
MVYRKLRTLGNHILMIRIRDRWPIEDLDSCSACLVSPGIGASLESFSLTLIDVGPEGGGLVCPIPVGALVAEVYDLVGIVPPPKVLPREFPVATISVFPLSEVPRSLPTLPSVTGHEFHR